MIAGDSFDFMPLLMYRDFYFLVMLLWILLLSAARYFFLAEPVQADGL